MPKIFKAPTYTEEEIGAKDEKEMTFPFSSKYMVYDGMKRQYIPTEALLLKHGIDIHEFLRSTGRDTPINLLNELEYISDQIYSFISKNSGSNVETLKWIVAKGFRRGISPFRFRVMFEEVLWKQARFYVDNDDLTKATGVDMEQKQWINKGVLNYEDRHIDPKLKMMLMDLGLCWVGSYDNQLVGLVNKQDW